MKKGIIITAIIFIVSSLLVIISAVALGVGGITQLVGYLKQSDSSQIISRVGDIADSISEGSSELSDRIRQGSESAADTPDLFGDRDFSIIGNPDLQISGDRASSIDVSEKDEIVIRADVASVVIKTTDDRFMSASADVYSKSSLSSGNEYELLIADDDYDVYLKSDKNIKNSVCELTVEIPEAYKGKVSVSVDVGTIEFDEATLENLDASVAVGNITADLLSVNRASFSVDTGDIEIKKGFFCFGGFDAKVQIGDVDYTVPEGRLVDVRYSVETGGVELNEIEDAGLQVNQTSETGVNGLNTSGKISGSYNADSVSEKPGVVNTVMTASIEVGIGSIEFDVL